jgi:hypothetical protein
MSQPQVKWTAKLPMLVAGVIAIVGGLGFSRRGWASIGFVLILLGAAFVIYSFTLKSWCELHEGAWGGIWGEMSFKGTLGECIRNKSLFSF